MHYKNNMSRSFSQILSLKLRKIKITARMYPSYDKSQILLIHSSSCVGKEVCSGCWNWVIC